MAQTTITLDVNVSPAEQKSVAENLVQKLITSATRVRHLLDEARRQKDVVKTTCLSDKLTQIEVAQKSAQEIKEALNAAITRGDSDRRNHEFSLVNVLRQQAEQLDAEASQCIGEELGFPGETTRQFEPNPNIDPVDPGAPPPVEVVIVPPLPASGFK